MKKLALKSTWLKWKCIYKNWFIVKNENDILLFGMFNILVFTLLYTFFFYDFKGIYLVFMVYTIFHLPSFLLVLILLAIERYYQKCFHYFWYILISILTYSFLFFIMNYDSPEEKNYFQLFDEHISIILILSVVSNALSYTFLYLINRLKKIK